MNRLFKLTLLMMLLLGCSTIRSDKDSENIQSPKEEVKKGIKEDNDKGQAYFLIEDVFSIEGRGSVVVGTVAGANIDVSDVVYIYGPDGFKFETSITGIELFRKIVDTARVDENAGLLLKETHKSDLQKWDLLTTEKLSEEQFESYLKRLEEINE